MDYGYIWLKGIGDPNDAFWLAQTHFLTGHYLRAERLLTEPLPSPRKSPSSRRESMDTEMDLLSRKSKGKARMYETMNGLGHSEEEPKKGRLVDESLACRYLAAQCLVSFHPWFPDLTSDETGPAGGVP